MNNSKLWGILNMFFSMFKAINIKIFFANSIVINRTNYDIIN